MRDTRHMPCEQSAAGPPERHPSGDHAEQWTRSPEDPRRVRSRDRKHPNITASPVGCATAEACNRVEHVVCGLGPPERLGIGVTGVDVGGDGGFHLTFIDEAGKRHWVYKQHWVVPDGVGFGPAHNESEPDKDNQRHRPTALPSAPDLVTAPVQLAIPSRMTDTRQRNTSRSSRPPAE
jgi:hypothetical protein